MVDNQCPDIMKSICSIVAPYECSMNQADIVNNCNKFLVLQLIHRASEVFFVYTRAGRVGQSGSQSAECFMDKGDAVKHFSDLFHSKTGVKWDSRQDDATLHKGKYQYVYQDTADDEVEDKDKITAVPAVVSPMVSDFIELIYDPKLYAQSTQSYRFNSNKLPLGSLSRTQLSKAGKVLDNILKLLKKKGKKAVDLKDDGVVVSKSGGGSGGGADEVSQLSSMFYTLIPTTVSKLKPIETPEQVQEKLELLELLENLSYTSTTSMVNTDVVGKYLNLDTKLTHVTDAHEIGLIRSYLDSNKGATHHWKLKINNIYSIDKATEKAHFAKWNSLHNRQLLWHGTGIANAVGILKTGFRINPTGVVYAGKMFGDGLYFANASSKSAGYMRAIAGEPGILFLCEIALGNMMELGQAQYVTKLPHNKHSTKGIGIYQPDTSSHVEHNGYTIPIGSLQKQDHKTSLNYDEFIVYDVSQIRMRYVVVLDVSY